MVTKRMPWGKHCGQRLTDIPTGYLAWLFNSARLDYDLYFAVEEELVRREAGKVQEDRATAERPIDFRALVRTWFATLSRKFHPDRGGSQEAMRAVNVAREDLEQLLAQQGVLVTEGSR